MEHSNRDLYLLRGWNVVFAQKLTSAETSWRHYLNTETSRRQYFSALKRRHQNVSEPKLRRLKIRRKNNGSKNAKPSFNTSNNYYFYN